MENIRKSGVVEKILRDSKRAEEIIKDKDYLNWLEKFIAKVGDFTTETWQYFPERISEEDNDKVKELTNLFTGIKNYAEDDYYESVTSSYGEYYGIKYNDNCYILGIEAGQGAYCYIKTCKDGDVDEFIDINNIIEGKKNPDRELIKITLINFENYLTTIVKDVNIPQKNIVAIVEKVYNNKKER